MYIPGSLLEYSVFGPEMVETPAWSELQAC